MTEYKVVCGTLNLTKFVDVGSPPAACPVDGCTNFSVDGGGVAPFPPDPTAVHKAVSGEINAMTVKGTPVAADVLVIEDSAATYAKKKVTIGTLPAGVDTTAIHKLTSSEISAITLKAAPLAADLLLIESIADGNAKRRITIGTLPAPTVTKLIPTTRIAATGGILQINVLAYTTLGYFDIFLNKASFTSIKLKVRSRANTAGNGYDIAVFQANDQKAAFTEVTGSVINYAGATTNWNITTGANFIANVTAGDVCLRIYGRSASTTRPGELDTTDEMFLEVI